MKSHQMPRAPLPFRLEPLNLLMKVRKHLTQSTLAEKLDVNRKTISRWETARSPCLFTSNQRSAISLAESAKRATTKHPSHSSTPSPASEEFVEDSNPSEGEPSSPASGIDESGTQTQRSKDRRAWQPNVASR